MILTSIVFDNGGKIPAKYTCNGENINPPLHINNIPKGTKYLALVMDDPDVPKSVREDGMWNHWVVFNIPATGNTLEIAEGVEPTGTNGVTTKGTLEYGGPCPPDCEHRYFFRVYALPAPLNLPEGVTKEEVEKTAKQMALANATLMGRYEQPGV